MSGLGNIKAKDIEKVLSKSNYKFHHQRGSHRYYVLGNKIIGVPQHKGKTLGVGLCHKIITKDMGITIDEFLKLI
ncbi:MAG: type II toxin-antitoxin system HicA family toxin [Candidatus Hydrogenedentota bacterium]